MIIVLLNSVYLIYFSKIYNYFDIKRKHWQGCPILSPALIKHTWVR